MNRIHRVIGSAVYILISASLIISAPILPKTGSKASKEDSLKSQILLCPDSAKTGKKLVYAYIDGKKTECMDEGKLRALLGWYDFEKDTVYKRDQSDKVMGNDIIAEIQKGRKDLRKLDLKKRDFMDIDLSATDMRGVDLSESDLRRVNLSGADLRKAKLDGAFLMGSKLNGAKLDSASLKDAYLMKADLTGVSGLTLEMLKGAVSLYNAKMDSTLLTKALKEFPDKFLAKKDRWKSKLHPESEGPAGK